MLTTLKYVCILLLCLHEVNGEKKTCSKLPNAAEPSALSALRKKLKCNYDIFSPPTNATNARVDIEIFMDRLRMQNYGTDGYLLADSLFLMTWQDDRLKWKASEYKNHTFLYLSVSDIWTPTVVVPGDGYFRDPRFLLIFSSGEVSYPLWWDITGNCKPVYAKWADRRICTTSFRLELAEKLRLTTTRLLYGRIAVKRSSWDVIEVKDEINEQMTRGNSTDALLARSKLDNNLGLVSLELHIEKRTAIMDASLFSPAAVLFVLLLASTWIPCKASIRLAVLALTTLLEIFLMHFATRAIPTLPGRFSDFAVLYRNMVLVSGAAFFEWLVSYFMACKKISPSGRLQAFAGTASQSSYAFIRSILLIPSNPSKVENGSPEGAFLSVILDRIAFIIFLIVFIIIMIITAHRPISKWDDDMNL